MGFACPVCGDPQADAGHLANHLAFTAITSGGDHEDWLDEHVPDWEQLGESELAESVVDHADETDYPQVFEASGLDTGHEHQEQDSDLQGHEHRGVDHGVDPAAARARGQGSLDDEAKSILDEAREITEEMRREPDEQGDGDGEESADSE